MRTLVRLALPPLLLLHGCASQPLPAPQTAQGTALGMQMKVRLYGVTSYRVDALYFLRDCSDADRACDAALITSSYATEGRVYLLNAEPGSYRAVAAMFRSGLAGDPSLYFVYFPQALVEATRVSLQPGRFAYAGSYLLDASRGVCPETADTDQLRYAEMLEAGTPKCGFWKPLLHTLATGDYIFLAGTAYPVGTQTFHHRGSDFQRFGDPAAAAAFGEAARSDLGAAGWSLAWPPVLSGGQKKPRTSLGEGEVRGPNPDR